MRDASGMPDANAIGPHHALTEAQGAAIAKAFAAGVDPDALAAEYGISRRSVYRYAGGALDEA